jgi:hypothetical protein
MLIEKDIQHILNQLSEGEATKVSLGGSDIFIRSIDNASKLSLITSVYYGGNYIPSSVRRCLSHKFPFYPSMRTYLTLDESNFQIHLHYLGSIESLNQAHFKELIEEFSWIADEWRVYLDEHDKNDLVYVRVK